MSNDFAALLEGENKASARGSQRLRAGQIVTGPVVQIGTDSVFVDVGATCEGRIDRHEFEDRAGVLQVRVGQVISATVLKVDDRMGPTLSTMLGKGGRSVGDEVALRTAKDAKVPVEGTVGTAVKGGVEVKVLGQRAFCPASQVGNDLGTDLKALEGQTLKFLIVEIRGQGKDIVVSRRALLDHERAQSREARMASLVVGEEYEGKVVSVQKFGAFVDVGGGVEGLVHVSELGRGRGARAQDLLAVGETVMVKLLEIQPSEKPGGAPKLRLSLKAGADAPSAGEAGEVLPGTVARADSAGLWVETAQGEGFVPLRELGGPRNADLRKNYPPGKEVRVVVVSPASNNRSMTLSLSRVARVEERQNFREFTQGGRTEESGMGTLGALLRQHLTDLAVAPAPAAPPAPAPAPTTSAAANAARSGAVPSRPAPVGGSAKAGERGRDSSSTGPSAARARGGERAAAPDGVHRGRKR